MQRESRSFQKLWKYEKYAESEACDDDLVSHPSRHAFSKALHLCQHEKQKKANGLCHCHGYCNIFIYVNINVLLAEPCSFGLTCRSHRDGSHHRDCMYFWRKSLRQGMLTLITFVEQSSGFSIFKEKWKHSKELFYITSWLQLRLASHTKTTCAVCSARQKSIQYNQLIPLSQKPPWCSCSP